MHFNSFLTAATVALGATCVSSKCFQSGQNWGNHAVAKAELAQACKQLQGHYGRNEVRTRCRNSGPVSFVFEIQNKGNGDTVISEAECNRNIGAQIDNCGHGGEITHSGVRFRYVLYFRRLYMIYLQGRYGGLLTQIFQRRSEFGKLLNTHPDILDEMMHASMGMDWVYECFTYGLGQENKWGSWRAYPWTPAPLRIICLEP